MMSPQMPVTFTQTPEQEVAMLEWGLKGDMAALHRLEVEMAEDERLWQRIKARVDANEARLWRLKKP